jgi:phage gp36-like protein
MADFIVIGDYDASIHAEILDSLIRSNSAIIEVCEDRAISQMRSYLNKRYDCDAIFSATGSDRHPLVLMFAIDIAIYHMFCIHNPYKMSAIRKERYDAAIEWLKAVADSNINIDGAPMLPDEEVAENSRWQIVSNEHHNNYF